FALVTAACRARAPVAPAFADAVFSGLGAAATAFVPATPFAGAALPTSIGFGAPEVTLDVAIALLRYPRTTKKPSPIPPPGCGCGCGWGPGALARGSAERT